MPSRHPHVHPVQRLCPLLEPPSLCSARSSGRRMALRRRELPREPVGRDGHQAQPVHAALLDYLLEVADSGDLDWAALDGLGNFWPRDL